MCSGLTRVRSGWMTLAAWSTETRKVPPRRGAWAEARRDKPDSAGNPAAEARTARRVGCLILSLLCFVFAIVGTTGALPCKVYASRGLLRNGGATELIRQIVAFKHIIKGPRGGRPVIGAIGVPCRHEAGAGIEHLVLGVARGELGAHRIPSKLVELHPLRRIRCRRLLRLLDQ